MKLFCTLILISTVLSLLRAQRMDTVRLWYVEDHSGIQPLRADYAKVVITGEEEYDFPLKPKQLRRKNKMVRTDAWAFGADSVFTMMRYYEHVYRENATRIRTVKGKWWITATNLTIQYNQGKKNIVSTYSMIFSEKKILLTREKS